MQFSPCTRKQCTNPVLGDARPEIASDKRVGSSLSVCLEGLEDSPVERLEIFGGVRWEAQEDDDNQLR